MSALELYKNSDIDLSVFGLSRGAEEGGYFCTPVGAKVIGWAGVDRIQQNIGTTEAKVPGTKEGCDAIGCKRKNPCYSVNG